MKFLHTVLLLLFFFISFLIPGIGYAANTKNTKSQILEMKGGSILLKKIDTIAIKIHEKVKKDDDLHKVLIGKIEILKMKYNQKADTKSQKIVIILTYLEEKISTDTNITNSRIIERFQKVEADKYQNKTSSRINKAKVQNYQRIHIKK